MSGYSSACPFCGTRKARGLDICEGCGARQVRRPNALGWVMIVSLILAPVYGMLRWMAPEMVAPRRWTRS